MLPKVFICYNSCENIWKNVGFCLGQTLKEIEIICIDGGSTNRLGKTLDKMIVE